MWQSVLNWLWVAFKRCWLWIFGPAGLILSVWDDASGWVKSWFMDILEWAARQLGAETFELMDGTSDFYPSWWGYVASGAVQLNQFFPLKEGSIIIFAVLTAVAAVRLTRYLLGLIPTLSIS